MIWYEIEVAGDAGAWERLLAEQEVAGGHRAVRGMEAPLRQALPAGHLLAYAPGELAGRLLAALAAVAADGPLPDPGLRLAGLREVTGSRFEFSVEAFAEPAAAAIRAALAAAPPGVEVQVVRDEEQRDGAAGGAAVAEPFAPLHCYAYRAWGTVTGPLPQLLEMHRRLHPLPFVYEGKIELAAQHVDAAAVDRPGD
jgi:hypothetical protein